jgi:hypothetical protein
MPPLTTSFSRATLPRSCSRLRTPQDPSNPLSLLQAALRGGPPEEARPRPAAAGAAGARRAVTR